MKRPISAMLLEIYNLGKSATEGTRPSDMERIDHIMGEIVHQIVSEAVEYMLNKENK